MRPSLFAAQERETKLTKLGNALQVLDRHVDFAALAAEVDRAAPRPDRSRGGRPPFPTEVMVRVLFIQQLFNLSDEQIKFQLLDRLSFQRFARLLDTSQIPDRTTIWTFKERLIKAGASASVFDAVNRQLARHGYIARGGQIIDASIVQVPKQSLSKEEKPLVDGGAMPADWSPPKRRQKDVDARWTKKHGKSFFGYKLSANADKRYKLIRKLKVSTASEHDTNHFEEVLDLANTSRAVLADKGYVDGERETRLAGACSPNARAARTSRCRRRRSAATGASPGRAPASSMYSPVWRGWAARRCAALAWRAPRSTCTGRRLPTTCNGCAT